jgi:hypothetical protein
VTLAEQKKTLQLARTSGEPLSLDLPRIDAKEIGCSVFFPHESRYVAVALTRLHSQADSLHIVVADTVTAKWVADFVVRAGGTLGTPLTLLGFLQDTSSLVVLGNNAGTSAKAFAITLLDIHGKEEAPPTSRTVPDNTSQVGSPTYADVKNNRLWFNSSPEYCPLRSIPLVGNGPEGPIVKESTGHGACGFLFARAYPDADTLMMAATREPRDLVWRVDLKEHSAEEIELPATGGYGSYTSVESGLLSPDGKVFAVVRERLSNNFFGEAHNSGDEIDLVQVKPLKLLGKIRPKRTSAPASFAIEHQNGIVTVLGYWDGKWRREQVKPN